MSTENSTASPTGIGLRLAGLSPEKRRLLEKRLAQGKPQESSLFEDVIAVTGMGCRFPGGSDNPEAYWQLLLTGGDAVCVVPDHRRAWFRTFPAEKGNVPAFLQQAGFLENVDQFDASFFNISPREAQQMDPQQRLLLLTAWEALEAAGQSASSLAGTDSGVFIGIHSQSSDYYWRQIADTSAVDTYTATGGAHSIVANRLSYFLDLRGPSMAVDTACSSSLVALHLACQSLRSRECDLGIVGGVNLLLSPDTSYAFSKLQFLSPQGRCRTFDAAADGFVRGEGCGVVVLRRYADAVKHREPVLALICGSAVNQDGATNGLTAPSGLSQQAVLRKALRAAGVEPGSITLVETHGTGTTLGDPIEVEALIAVLQGQSGGEACYLGAVKSNIGHLEAAAGIAGLIKAILCLRHRFIPANLHFNTLNQHIELSNTRFKIPRKGVAWVSGGHPRTAGVSSFGFGGTNAHVILREAPEAVKKHTDQDQRPRLFLLSARNEVSLKELAGKYAAYVISQPQLSLTDLCYTLHVGRTHFEHRLAVVAESIPQLSEELKAFVGGRTGTYMASGVAVGPADSDFHREEPEIEKLRRVGISYVLDEPIDLQRLYEKQEGRIIELPTYSWQLIRFWVEDESQKEEAGVLSGTEGSALERKGDFYRVAWRRKEAGEKFAAAPPDDWIIFKDRLGVGDQLLELLQGQGCRCYTVREGAGYRNLGQGRFEIAATSETDYRQLAQSIVGLCGTGRIGAVYLWGLNVTDPESGDAEQLHQEVIQTCGGALLLQKFFCDPAVFEEARLWLVSRGAQTVAETPVLLPNQAPLWGLGRVMALESPDSLAGMVDLDPDAEPETCSRQLFGEILNSDGEEQIGYRGSHRYIARLIHEAPDRATVQPRGFDAHGSYLITGGLGRIGLMLARWMAERGAGHLVLLSRSGLTGKEEPDELRSARAAGATVCVVSGDVSDKTDMDALFSRFEKDLPQLRGIVHAAGVIAPEPLQRLTVAELSAACAPKVLGTWILHGLTRGLDLDFFILFSSAAAILGARELAHYAAANHFQDAFAHYAHNKGLPACSINWGWWAGGWQDDHLTRHFSRSGLNALTPTAGMAALEDCLSARTVQTLFADIDWQRLGPIYSSKKRRPFLDELETAGASLSMDKAGDSRMVEELRRALPDRRQKLLLDYIRSKTAALLGFGDASKIDVNAGFFKIGMDSILAVELKEQIETAFGLILPETAAFEYPTVTALAGYLDGLLSGHPASASDFSGPILREEIAPAEPGFAERGKLSEDELIRLLSQKVREVR